MLPPCFTDGETVAGVTLLSTYYVPGTFTLIAIILLILQ